MKRVSQQEYDAFLKNAPDLDCDRNSEGFIYTVTHSLNNTVVAKAVLYLGGAEFYLQTEKS